MSALVCELDIHKESTYATILGPDGEIVNQRRMPNEKVLDFLRPRDVEKVAMEASTSMAPLYRKLVEEGCNFTVSYPRKIQYIAEVRIKSDRVNSRALAELLRLNNLPESYMPPPHIAVLREKVRRRARALFEIDNELNSRPNHPPFFTRISIRVVLRKKMGESHSL